MADTLITVDRADGVRELILNRPDERNALDAELWEKLGEAFTAAAEDDQVKVVILKGRGRGFSAGNDLVKRANREEDVERDRRNIERRINTCLQLWDMEKPVIAQVHGFAYGMATIMCICADLVYVADDVKFGWPVLPLGGGMLSPIWSWYVGPHKSKELSFLVGSTVTAQEAVSFGVANAALPLEQLEDKVDAVAASIARLPLDILRLKKKANNLVFNTLGFRDIARMGASWNATAHASEGVVTARTRVKELGVRGARDWYAAG